MKSIDSRRIKLAESLLRKRFSYRKINEKTGISIGKISQIKRKMRIRGDKPTSQAKNGRPRKKSVPEASEG